MLALADSRECRQAAIGDNIEKRIDRNRDRRNAPARCEAIDVNAAIAIGKDDARPRCVENEPLEIPASGCNGEIAFRRLVMRTQRERAVALVLRCYGVTRIL